VTNDPRTRGGVVYAEPVGRTLSWHAWCADCGWDGPTHDYKGAASSDARAHNRNTHPRPIAPRPVPCGLTDAPMTTRCLDCGCYAR